MVGGRQYASSGTFNTASHDASHDAAAGDTLGGTDSVHPTDLADARLWRRREGRRDRSMDRGQSGFGPGLPAGRRRRRHLRHSRCHRQRQSGLRLFIAAVQCGRAGDARGHDHGARVRRRPVRQTLRERFADLVLQGGDHADARVGDHPGQCGPQRLRPHNPGRDAVCQGMGMEAPGRLHFDHDGPDLSGRDQRPHGVRGRRRCQYGGTGPVRSR